MRTTLADIRSDDFKTEPYWWEAVRPGIDLHTRIPEEADVAIVGSGFAGLSAATELARAGLRVAVLEAEGLGWGASTRNGGMISGGVNVAKGTAMDQGNYEAMLEEAAAAYQHLADVVEREKIECFYQSTGRFVGAHCQSAYEALAARVETLNRVADAGAEMVPRARQGEEVATDLYFGGMRVAKSGGVHPALLHRGMLEAAHGAGATLSADTRVGKIVKRDGGFDVETSKGPIRVKEVIVATNGYTGDATPDLKRRVVPVASYIIATEDLGEDLIKELFPNLRMIADTKRILYYYRPSPDRRRVLFGGRASFATRSAAETAPKLYDFMCGVFPELRGVKITHAWNGNVAFTFDRVPHMGSGERDMTGMHWCLGCNGSGVVMMTHLGHRTALKILGRSNRPSAFDMVPTPTAPLYNGWPWFLPLVGEYYRARDWLDRKVLG